MIQILAYPATHTQTFAYGVLKTQRNVDCDINSIGKCLAGGVAMGAHGMTEELAQIAIDNIDRFNMTVPVLRA